jgi:hypothetical protein
MARDTSLSYVIPTSMIDVMFANRAREATMPQDRFTFVDAGTPDEPSKIEVRKDGRAIGRILHVAESQHVGAIYRFYRDQSTIDLKTAAQYSDLDELKKWIRETQ